MLVTLNEILPKARRGHYAIGAFNTSNLEITQAILRAAQNLNAPVIIAASEKAIKYAGIENLSHIVRSLAEETKIPVVLHLDHGSSLDMAKECIKNNFKSVMIDASHLLFKENLRVTKKVVNYAHKFEVSVEAEIGRLAGIEEDLVVGPGDVIYTDPKQAKRFVEASGCDALAIAIGTSHGAYKFKGKPRLRIDILKQIAQEVRIPLVLHGASGVKKKWVSYVNRFGGQLGHAQGVPDSLLQTAIRNGICKINVDTDLRIAFTAGVREYLTKNKKDFDPRKIIGHACDLIQTAVEDRIKVFGSNRKA